jgi:Flp pilus assembly protein TadG
MAVKRIRRSGTDQGSAAVEFALVLPVLVLILFGIIDFGRMLNARITLSQAAHEGARAAAVADTATAASTINTVMGALVSDMAPPVIDGCDGTPGDQATVTLTYQFAWVTPIFGGARTMTTTAVVPCL